MLWILLQCAPQSSLNTHTTPKEWKSNGYTLSKTRMESCDQYKCSKAIEKDHLSFSTSQMTSKSSYCGNDSLPLSDLQQTLVECGKLTLADSCKNNSLNTQVQRGQVKTMRHVLSHSKWLQHRNGSTDSAGISILKSSTKFSERKSSSSSSTVESCSSLSLKSATKSKKTVTVTSTSMNSERERAKVERGRDDVFDKNFTNHLDLHMPNYCANPYRSNNSSALTNSAAVSSISVKNNLVDSKSYSRLHKNVTIGRYNAVIENDINPSLPSQELVAKSLVQLSRRIIVCYDSRIVETGGLLKVNMPMKVKLTVSQFYRAFFNRRFKI